MFRIYFLVGVLNTTLHWLIFVVLYYIFMIPQSYGNLCAFIIVVNFSYYINAKLNFKKKLTLRNYMIFVSSMGLLSFLIGWLMDMCNGWPLLTLMIFSGSSLILGYLLSKFIVFR